jgi:hypothetical protein
MVNFVGLREVVSMVGLMGRAPMINIEIIGGLTSIGGTLTSSRYVGSIVMWHFFVLKA